MSTLSGVFSRLAASRRRVAIAGCVPLRESPLKGNGDGMPLVIRCTCGRKMRIGPDLAGRKIACPACKKHYQITPERYADLERRQSSTAPAPPTPQPASAAPRRDPMPRPPADPQPVELDLGAPADSDDRVLFDLAAQAESAASTAAPSVVILESDPHEIGYAGADAPVGRHLERSAGDMIQAPKHRYPEEAIGSFLYPFTSVGNVINFVIILVISLFSVPLGYAGCLGLIGQACIFGWLAAVYLSVVQDTAAGQDDLPGIRMEQGPFEDILVPMVKFIASVAMAFLPVIGGILLTALGAPWLTGVASLAWIPIGVFLMPICLLLFALSAHATFMRPHLILSTILRSFGGYMSTWAFLLIVAALYLLPHLNEFLDYFGVTSTTLSSRFQLNFGTNLLVAAFQTYLMLVAMRVIGLYYRHFKHRFTIVLE